MAGYQMDPDLFSWQRDMSLGIIRMLLLNDRQWNDGREVERRRFYAQTEETQRDDDPANCAATGFKSLQGNRFCHTGRVANWRALRAAHCRVILTRRRCSRSR